MAAEQFHCELPATARSVTQARRFVVDALASWHLDGLADTAALLTSEVVTNAVLHARTAMELVVRRLDDGVSVEVSDGSRQRPRGRQADADATNGRGLELLALLASDWAVDLNRAGKTVRFTITGDSDPWAAFSSEQWALDQ
jgi:anti-sigma regulatory factor (Ser/Thr protein kinase)